MVGTTSSKRRASNISPHEPANKKKNPASEVPANVQKSSCLLELPIELFDMILGYVAADAGAFLPNKSISLHSPSGLMCVSNYVRDEYQSVLDVSATEIRTEVRKFDFSHLVSFFNRLSDRELHTLPAIVLPTESKFVIKLFPTQATNPEQLHRWLLRLESTTKKGAKIAVEYTKSYEDYEWYNAYSNYTMSDGSFEEIWPIIISFDKWL